MLLQQYYETEVFDGESDNGVRISSVPERALRLGRNVVGLDLGEAPAMVIAAGFGYTPKSNRHPIDSEFLAYSPDLPGDELHPRNIPDSVLPITETGEAALVEGLNLLFDWTDAWLDRELDEVSSARVAVDRIREYARRDPEEDAERRFSEEYAERRFIEAFTREHVVPVERSPLGADSLYNLVSGLNDTASVALVSVLAAQGKPLMVVVASAGIILIRVSTGAGRGLEHVIERRIEDWLGPGRPKRGRKRKKRR